jgi:hypothetical protein
VHLNHVVILIKAGKHDVLNLSVQTGDGCMYTQ